MPSMRAFDLSLKFTVDIFLASSQLWFLFPHLLSIPHLTMILCFSSSYWKNYSEKCLYSPWYLHFLSLRTPLNLPHLSFLLTLSLKLCQGCQSPLCCHILLQVLVSCHLIFLSTAFDIYFFTWLPGLQNLSWFSFFFMGCSFSIHNFSGGSSLFSLCSVYSWSHAFPLFKYIYTLTTPKSHAWSSSLYFCQLTIFHVPLDT